ncbi:NIPSNAP family protein [Muriicola marianensis]|uniref:NIPSNAP domain-containing protein n=1 Tax=Muriicola marianensis TaxID=1324801 RepID=A0ABQ1QWY6_9FLAO|nr:NIPSNAP family protein [Muriicola marianensis]GGD47562.1 hypothetical protein GCM10011361_12930 [Muriicola marianensis]
MKKLACLLSLLFLVVSSIRAQDQVYELRMYELEFFRPAEVLHSYFEDALIPALNRQGVSNVGAFEEIGESLPKKIYLLIPYKDITSFQNSSSELSTDEAYQQAASPYLTSGQDMIPYKRINVSLIHSTESFPELQVPADPGLFELRIYESHNEDALRRKLKMFESEFNIFEDAGLSMVFFGKNITGDQMPCLTYMLATADMEENKKGWANFVEHPQWKKLLAMEEFKNSMSDITRVFLKPLNYSQL